MANQVNVFAPPAGPGKDVASIVTELKNFRDERQIPEGEVIMAYGYDETSMPDGLVMETAWLPIFGSLPKPTPEQEVEWIRAGQMLYAAAGVTTAHEGATHAADIAIMQRAAAGGATIIDVIAFPFILDLDAILKDNPPATFGSYKNRFKLGGVKITLDGSPQGRTAFFTTPYLVDGPNGEKNWSGEQPFPQDTVNGWL